MDHIFKEHLKRSIISLNGEWLFCTDKDDIGKREEWYKNFFENAGYINVPSCWNNELGLYSYIGKAWYEKKIEVTDNCFFTFDFRICNRTGRCVFRR